MSDASRTPARLHNGKHAVLPRQNESRRREINSPARNSGPMGAEEVNARQPMAAGCALRGKTRTSGGGGGGARACVALTTMQQYRRLGLRGRLMHAPTAQKATLARVLRGGVPFRRRGQHSIHSQRCQQRNVGPIERGAVLVTPNPGRFEECASVVSAESNRSEAPGLVTPLNKFNLGEPARLMALVKHRAPPLLALCADKARASHGKQCLSPSKRADRFHVWRSQGTRENTKQRGRFRRGIKRLPRGL